MGADTETQRWVGRGVGWLIAHATLDHHSQAAAELLDSVSDASDDFDLDDTFDYADSDSDSYVSSDAASHSHVQQRFGAAAQPEPTFGSVETSVCTGCGGTGKQRCHLCSGQGYTRWPSSGEPESCWTCSGTGEVTCWTCGDGVA